MFNCLVIRELTEVAMQTAVQTLQMQQHGMMVISVLKEMGKIWHCHSCSE